MFSTFPFFITSCQHRTVVYSIHKSDFKWPDNDNAYSITTVSVCLTQYTLHISRLVCWLCSAQLNEGVTMEDYDHQIYHSSQSDLVCLYVFIILRCIMDEKFNASLKSLRLNLCVPTTFIGNPL